MLAVKLVVMEFAILGFIGQLENIPQADFGENLILVANIVH